MINIVTNATLYQNQTVYCPVAFHQYDNLIAVNNDEKVSVLYYQWYLNCYIEYSYTVVVSRLCRSCVVYTSYSIAIIFLFVTKQRHSYFTLQPCIVALKFTILNKIYYF